MADAASADLRAFIAQLKTVGDEVPKAARKALRGAGGVVAGEAARIVAPHSSSIPPTIRVSVAGGRVSVLAGGKGSTRGLARRLFAAGYGTEAADRAYRQMQTEAAGNVLAGLYEYGNTGGSRGATFRHPVFGTDTWVNQPRFEFLRPAAKNKMPEVEAEVLRVVDRYWQLLADR